MILFIKLTVSEGMNIKVLSFGAKDPGGTVKFKGLDFKSFKKLFTLIFISYLVLAKLTKFQEFHFI
jgi:hypothetical protein